MRIDQASVLAIDWIEKEKEKEYRIGLVSGNLAAYQKFFVDSRQLDGEWTESTELIRWERVCDQQRVGTVTGNGTNSRQLQKYSES